MIKLAAALCFVALAAGCQPPALRSHAPATVRFFLEESAGSGAVMKLPQSESEISVGSKPVLTEFDIVAVDLADVAMGKCLKFEFTAAAARDLQRLSAAQLGQRLVLSIDGAPMGARRIDQIFNEGTLLIFVETPDSALPALAENLRQTARALQQAAAK